jgi:hypothetical protein
MEYLDNLEVQAQIDKAIENERHRIVAELEKQRDELCKEWSPKKATWQFAILIANGHFTRKRKKELVEEIQGADHHDGGVNRSADGHSM